MPHLSWHMLTKDKVLNEIRRVAAENGGIAPGKVTFLTATGIRESDWIGRLWTSWSAAVREAGLEPRTMNLRLQDDVVLRAAAQIVRKCGRFPTAAEIRFECNTGSGLPSHNTFLRFGGIAGLRTRLCEFARERGLQDLIDVLRNDRKDADAICQEPEKVGDQSLVEGFVYLIKSGRHFKIGKANSVESRHRQLKIQLPQSAVVVHRIRTDDPYGIESYWHRRFADKRLNGEWFTLSVEDVKQFKRRTFM